MDTIGICKQCHKQRPHGAPEGLCPECLARVALGSEPSLPRNRVPPEPAELALQFPHLEILDLLGMGGMGMVYKARQPKLERLVALKILPMASMPDASFAERFEREAKALARLSHPGIVAVYDFGQTQDYFYFIMEFVDGTNLRQLIHDKTLEPRQALELVLQICSALQYAHDEKIVHRDVKPENILIDKKGNVKIADFGIAKLMGSKSDMALTGSRIVMGTVNYMAPEQRENTKDVDHRADIYSLGVVFYEMLTGEVPMGRFDAPSKKVQIDVRLDEVVLHALEREPSRRYQRISEVKTNVESINLTMPKETPARPSNQGTQRLPSPGAVLLQSLVPFVLFRFALFGGAWFGVALVVHFIIGDVTMAMTLKDGHWTWLLDNWNATFPPSAEMSLSYIFLGAIVSCFNLRIAGSVLAAFLALCLLAGLESSARCGLKVRQLPPPIRRRHRIWIGATLAGYVVVVLATAYLYVAFDNVRPFSMGEIQKLSDQSTEFWFVPSSGAYEKLGFQAKFIDRDKQIPSVGVSTLPTCLLSLFLHQSNAQPVVMKVVLPGLRTSYRIPTTNSWDNTFVLDKESLVAWFHLAGGIDTSRSNLLVEIDQVYSLLKTYQIEPPATVKEFVNLGKADLHRFYFLGMKHDPFAIRGNGFLLWSLCIESLIYIGLHLWIIQRLFAEGRDEINSNRWTPPARPRPKFGIPIFGGSFKFVRWIPRLFSASRDR